MKCKLMQDNKEVMESVETIYKEEIETPISFAANLLSKILYYL